MVKWNGKRDVIGMILILFSFPILAALAAIAVPLIMISPLFIIVFTAMVSGLGYFIFKKRKH